MIGVLLASAIVTGVVAKKATNRRRAANNYQNQTPVRTVVSNSPPKQEPSVVSVPQREIGNKEFIQQLSKNDLLAKYAMCCYIARADGVLSANEKNTLCTIYQDLCAQYSDQQYRNELSIIFYKANWNFILLESYLRKTSTETIASFLELADEVSRLDCNVTESEKECLYKIRRYLSDRSGKNYMRNSMSNRKSLDVMCPGCGANMVIREYEQKMLCPFCGNVKYY